MTFSVTRIFAGVAIALAGAVVPARALAQAPSVSSASPGAAAPGQSMDVTLHGANLSGPTGLWTSFPCSASLSPDVPGNGQDPARVTYRLAVPADTPPSMGALRVITGQGV